MLAYQGRDKIYADVSLQLSLTSPASKASDVTRSIHNGQVGWLAGVLLFRQFERIHRITGTAFRELKTVKLTGVHQAKDARNYSNSLRPGTSREPH